MRGHVGCYRANVEDSDIEEVIEFDTYKKPLRKPIQ